MWIVIWALATVTGCGVDGCVEGETQECVCAGAAEGGVQVCSSDQTWGVCSCDPGTVGPDDGTEAETDDFSYVFTTRTRYPGDLGGLTGADRLCNAAAQSAGLPGTYTAWLSDDDNDAIDRIVGQGPWVHPRSETTVFNNDFALLTVPRVPMNVDEFGDQISTAAGFGEVWTATNRVGQLNGLRPCENWTDINGSVDDATIGQAHEADRWTVSTGSGCFIGNHLYCFGD